MLFLVFPLILSLGLALACAGLFGKGKSNGGEREEEGENEEEKGESVQSAAQALGPSSSALLLTFWPFGS